MAFCRRNEALKTPDKTKFVPTDRMRKPHSNLSNCSNFRILLFRFHDYLAKTYAKTGRLAFGKTKTARLPTLLPPGFSSSLWTTECWLNTCYTQ